MLGVIVHLSCQKDPSLGTSITSECQNFGNSTGGFWWVVEHNYPLASAPRFNPSDPQEIIYIKRTAPGIQELVKYNFITEEESFIINGVWGHPDWNKMGWIVFNHADNQIWKIKDNGDSLIRLTNVGSSYDAIWNPDGTRLAIRSGNGQQSNIFILADRDGNPYDTLINVRYKRSISWSTDDKITLFFEEDDDFGIGYIDLGTEEIVQITHSFGTLGIDRILSMSWIDTTSIVWVDGHGVHLTEIGTGATTNLLTGCDAKTFLFLDARSTESVIVAQIDRKLLSSSKIQSSYYLTLLNLCNGKSTKLDL